MPSEKTTRQNKTRSSKPGPSSANSAKSGQKRTRNDPDLRVEKKRKTRERTVTSSSESSQETSKNSPRHSNNLFEAQSNSNHESEPEVVNFRQASAFEKYLKVIL